MDTINSKEVKINKKVSVGDAGIPMDIEITVWYEENDDTITVIDSEDNGGPENMPMWWPDKIGQIIEDYFDTKKVVYKSATNSKEKIKHTAGPWVAELQVLTKGYKHRKKYTTPNYYRISAGDGFFDNRNPNGFGITGYVSEADAKLIAAAPELLEACKRYMEILKEYYGDMPVFMRPITNVMESAIKKAVL